MDKELPPWENPKDPDCICYGNWRSIVKRTEHLIDRRFYDKHTKEEYTFFGIVHGSVDYYYGMMGRYGVRLSSCVGSLETNGYILIEEDKKDEREVG